MPNIQDELLEALEGLFSLHEPEGRFQPFYYKTYLAKARNAIARAKGSDVLPIQIEPVIAERDRIIRALVSQMRDAAGAIDESVAMPCDSTRAKLPTTSARLLHRAKQAEEMIAIQHKEQRP